MVTITGKAVAKPSHFLARIGTPVSALIDAAGGMPDSTAKSLAAPHDGTGGNDPEVPVTKGTSGVLLMKDEESKRKEYIACIRCSRCVSACPMGLEPYLLMTLSEKQIFDRAESNNIMDCIECGSCSFTCPSNRPLLDYIRFGKGKVGQIIRSRKK